MAIATEQLKHFMDSLGGRPEDNLKMLLYYGDLGGDFTEDEDWGALCELALAADDELGLSQEFSSRYAELFGREEFQGALDAMEYDLKDNKIFAAMAIHKMGIPKKMPMVAAAAFNKHSYLGLKDGFALVRFLHWSGFDINAASPSTSMTPLHLFSSTKVQPGTHPRAVEWLLEREADVDGLPASDADGNTPAGMGARSCASVLDCARASASSNRRLWADNCSELAPNMRWRASTTCSRMRMT